LLYINSQLSNNRTIEQFSGSQAVYRTTFKDTGGYQKAGTSSLKRVTGRNFTTAVVSDFIEASRNFYLGVPSQKDNKKLKK
jgi:hypothetical protein